MRRINSLADAQIVINELLDFNALLTTKNIDLHKRKVINAAPAVDPNDYVILSQLPTLVQAATQEKQHYTQVFSNGNAVTDGMLIPAFVAGRERTGNPTQVWLTARGAPSSGPLVINFQIDGANILASNLILPQGSNGPVITSSFTNPLPFIKYLSTFYPTIIAAGGASVVSIGLVVKRNKA